MQSSKELLIGLGVVCLAIYLQGCLVNAQNDTNTSPPNPASTEERGVILNIDAMKGMFNDENVLVE